MEQTGKISKKIVSEQLRKHGAQIYGALPDGTSITRAEALSELLWRKALGYEEEITDDEGNRKTVKVEPQSWAIQCVVDRLEGKPVSLVEVAEESIMVQDKITTILKDQMNALAQNVTEEVKDDADRR